MHLFRRVVMEIVTVAVVMGAIAPWAAAGPLDPPPGPVAATFKTLAEVEPRIAITEANTPGDGASLYRIEQPGSYYLIGPVSGVAGKGGIVIAADDVTIDLNGFTMSGVAGSGSGVHVVGPMQRPRILNGTVANWGGEGVRSDQAIGARIEGVTSSQNETGFHVGRDAVVIECSALSNNLYGFWSEDFATFVGCVSADSLVAGFRCSGGANLSRCAARSNGVGFQISGNAAITGCIAVGEGWGFHILDGGVVSDSSASGSINHAFKIESGASAVNCVAIDTNGVGFTGGEGVQIIGCTATASTLAGISVGAGSVVRDCVARDNGGPGITTGDRVVVIGCTATGNTLDGVRIANDCVAMSNLCSGNGAGAGSGAGILAQGIDSRIEANTCTDNDRGVEVTMPTNFIVRNICSGNTSNWNIVADNRYGGISNITAIPGAAVTGLGGATSTLTTSDPWANFSY